jgi:hypothetical protein
MGRRGIRLFTASAVMVAATALPVTSAHAKPPTARSIQTTYATATVNLSSGAFMARKRNFLSAGCANASTCRKPGPYNHFDWSSDSCSWTPPGWRNLFDSACQQHDFGRRNFGKGLTLGRNETTRLWIDNRFHAEMNAICTTKYKEWWQYANKKACLNEAQVMYTVVRGLNNWSD